MYDSPLIDDGYGATDVLEFHASLARLALAIATKPVAKNVQASLELEGLAGRFSG